MDDIIKLYQDLVPPTPIDGVDVYSATRAAKTKHLRVGKNFQGNPIIILSSDSLTHFTPVIMKHISLIPSVTCTIKSHDGTVEQGSFTLIVCLSSEPVLHKYFLETVGRLASLDTSDIHLDRLLLQLAYLFQTLELKPQRTAVGLWGELVIIYIANDCHSMIRAWHNSRYKVHDFSHQETYMEIKTTSSNTRKHHFSYHQINPTGSYKAGVIGSLLATLDGGNVSIHQLADKIRERVATDLEVLLRFEQVLLECVGDDMEHIFPQAFNLDHSIKNIKFFSASDIPAIREPLRQGVSNVSFESDLSFSAPTKDLFDFGQILDTP